MVSKSKEVATPETAETEAIPAANPLADYDWSNVRGYQDAFQVFGNHDQMVYSSVDVIGDGFDMIDKKEAVDREFLIIDWKFITDKQTNREYASVRVINPTGGKFRFNDGSTGIYQQLLRLTAMGIHGGIHCLKGLRVSDYQLEDGTAARTYYLA